MTIRGTLFRRTSSPATGPDATPAVEATAHAVTAETGAEDLAVAVIDTQASHPTDLNLSAETQFNIIRPSHDNIMVNTRVKAPEELLDGKRESMDLVCVLDVSSSMNGASKLDLCKNTLEFVASQLSPNDRLALIVFSNTVRKVQGLSKMDEQGKLRFKDSVKTVRAQGMTNLSGGLLKGVEEIMGQRQDGGAPNAIQSVLLLTDGQANVGLRDKDAIVDILRNSSKPEDSESHKFVGLPFSVFTFGFGTDHNVELLKAVSDTANGSYYFIDDLDKVANAFGDCLGGLLSIVAQNTTLEIQGANGSSVNEVYTDYPTSKKDNGKVVIELGDLYAEEERNILSSIDLHFPPALFANAKADTQVEICKVKLCCVNLITKKTETKEMGVCVLVRPPSLQLTEDDAKENITIEIHYNRWETSKVMAKADKMCDDLRNKEAAVKLINERMERLQDLAVKSSSLSSSARAPRLREVSLLSEMQTDLQQCCETVQRTNRANMMQKKGFMMNKMNKLGRERGNSFTNHSDDEDDAFGMNVFSSCSSASAKTKKSAKSVFETRSKTMAKSKASASKW